MERAIFRKSLYYKWKLDTENSDVVELYSNIEDEPAWVNEMDNQDITRYELEANQTEKDKHGIETIFVVNRYTDLAEWMGRIIIHPDWVERIKDENSL
jgi:hypothetical protein